MENELIVEEEGAKLNLYFPKQNGTRVYVGFIYQECDGFYVFMPPEAGHGFWSEHYLQLVLSKLTELNKGWNEFINENLKV